MQGVCVQATAGPVATSERSCTQRYTCAAPARAGSRARERRARTCPKSHCLAVGTELNLSGRAERGREGTSGKWGPVGLALGGITSTPPHFNAWSTSFQRWWRGGWLGVASTALLPQCVSASIQLCPAEWTYIDLVAHRLRPCWLRWGGGGGMTQAGPVAAVLLAIVCPSYPDQSASVASL